MLPLLRNPQYRLLDAWRGVACLLIVVHHAGFAVDRIDAAGTGAGHWLRWAIVGLLRLTNLGVPFFFVISGYCIAASADANRRRDASPHSFLKRRLRRIYPPYWVALACFVAIITALDVAGLSRLHFDASHALRLSPPGNLHWTQWIGNVTLTETWRPRFWGQSQSSVYTHVAWSLCHEEQFYLLCFALLWVAPRRLYEALAWLTAAIVAFRIFAWQSGALASIDGTFPVYWHEFAAGLGCYWSLNVTRSPTARRCVAAALVLMCGIGLSWGIRSTAGAGGFGLALLLLRRFDHLADSAAWLRFLGGCGRRCYSIYLAHVPVCTIGNTWLYEQGLTGFWARVLVMVPLVSLAATGVGWLFFDAVERHFLNPPLVSRSAAKRGGDRRRSGGAAPIGVPNLRDPGEEDTGRARPLLALDRSR